MATYNEIKNKVEDWDKQHPADLENFVNDRLKELDLKKTEIFKQFNCYIEYIEKYNLKEIIPLSYLDAKYHLNQIAPNSEEITLKERENAFYDWLKVCINSENDPTIDFYFKTNSLSKEEQIKEILFENNGKGELKKIFKSDDWQIRLRKIITWFLKRYDLRTAKRLHSELTNKKWFETLDLIPLRLISATLIGFMPLLFNPTMWNLPVKWSFLRYITLIIIPAFLVLFYFMYECYKTIDGEKNTRSLFKRVLPVFSLGLIFSFMFSFIFYTILSSQFVSVEKDYLRIIPFFAIIALSIGVIVQIIWVEKTAPEPF